MASPCGIAASLGNCCCATQPFEYAERLAALVQRQQEIEDELDLTKNQASSQLDTRSSEETSGDAHGIMPPVEA